MSEFIEESTSAPEIIAIGGSAGSVRFLLTLAPALPRSLEIPILIVIHRMRNEISMLHQILENRLGLPAKEADDKEELRSGIIYVAPPNYHLLVEEDRTFALADMELVNHSRPSIDVTFQSVADVFREKAAGILLSGANQDGAHGLADIARHGGRAIAQCPAEAEVATMPQAAVDSVRGCEVMGREELVAFFKKVWSPGAEQAAAPSPVK